MTERLSVVFKRNLVLVLCLAGLLTLPWLDRSFYSRGEPREALVAQAMIATDNWISPPAYDGAVPSKPPFSHWLTALASLPGGEVTETTARLPSALAVILFAASFYCFLSRRLSDDTALSAALILLSLSQWFMSASTCRVDTILAVSFAGALLALFAWFERRDVRSIAVAVLLLICATLTKGPLVGLLMPLGIFGLFCWSESRFSCAAALRLALLVLAIAIPVIVVSSAWYVAGYLERGADFIVKIRYENLDRMTSSMHDEPHKHSAFWLLGMFGVGLLPWALVWLFDIAKARVGGWGSFGWRAVYQSYRNRPALERFSLLVTLIITVAFCVPSGKRAVYLLPAYPFVAILAAATASGWANRHPRFLAALTAVFKRVSLILASLLVLVFACKQYLGSLPAAQEYLTVFLAGLAPIKVVTLAILFYGTWFALQRGVGLAAHARVSLWMVNVVAIASFTVVDPVMLSLSPKRWLSGADSPIARGQVPTDRQFYSFGSEAYAASFYLQRQFKRALGPVPAGSIVFLQQHDLQQFAEEIAPRFVELGRHASPFESSRRFLVAVRVE
jgi:4-amino-4-deoxy-L-arabinose transferase-like glycosyltransferase